MFEFDEKNLHLMSNYCVYLPNELNKDEYVIKVFFKPHDRHYETDSNNFKEDFKKIMSKVRNDNVIYLMPLDVVFDDTTKNDYVFYKKILDIISKCCTIIMQKSEKIKKQVVLIVQNVLENDFAEWVHTGFADYSQEPFLIEDLREKERTIANNDEFSGNEGGTPLAFGGSAPQITNSQSLSKPKVKVLAPPSPKAHGFTNIWLLSLIIIGSLIFGIGIAWLLVK